LRRRATLSPTLSRKWERGRAAASIVVVRFLDEALSPERKPFSRPREKVAARSAAG